MTSSLGFRPGLTSIAAWSSGPEARTGLVLWLAAWFGALAGIADVSHLTVRHLVTPNPESGFRWDLLWLAPLAAAAAFLALALALLLLLAVFRLLRRGALGPGGIPVKPLVFGFALLGCYNTLQSRHLHLHRAAGLLLSAGLAVACARAIAQRWPGFVRVLRRSSLPLAALMALSTAAGLVMLPTQREGRALSRLAPARDGLPNVLLLILDTVRAPSLSLYGYDKPTTPNLARWAARGVVFDRAIATAPWTLPSHGSLLTGRHPQELSGAHRRPLDDQYPTLAGVLSAAGYATAGFVANTGYGSRISGMARGFARYEDYPITWGHFLVSSWVSGAIARQLVALGRRPWRTGRKDAVANTDDFLEWLSRREQTRPFFALLNYMDAHSNYDTAPERILRRFQATLPVRVPQGTGSEVELAPAKAAYDASIAFLDEQLDRLLTELERRHLQDRTLVIVTSDHGEQFGEHGLPEHGNSLYLFALHVPLLVIYPPHVPAGLRVATPISLRDVPATVMDLIGAPTRPPFPGRSLRRFWTGQAGPLAGVEPVASEVTQPYIQSVLVHPYHFIRRRSGTLELYDVAADYRESTDLSRAPEQAGTLARLSATLDSIWAAAPPHPSRAR